jgi:hypothetical protein
MGCTAVYTGPALILPLQPFRQSVTSDRFHILQYASLIQPLCVFHKLSHLLAGINFGTFFAKFKTFLSREISGWLSVFTSVTWFSSCPAFVFNRMGQAPL